MIATPELAPDLHEFIGDVDPPNDWVIDGLLERGDRLIWTGYRGTGQEVMTRQLAVAAAAGVHPFTGEPADPLRVLFIDCENPDRKSRRHFREAGGGRPRCKDARRCPRAAADHPPARRHRPDPRGGRGRGCSSASRRTSPDLLVIGPLYRLHARTSTRRQRPRRSIAARWTRRRSPVDCALIIEAHAPHGEAAARAASGRSAPACSCAGPSSATASPASANGETNGHHAGESSCSRGAGHARSATGRSAWTLGTRRRRLALGPVRAGAATTGRRSRIRIEGRQSWHKATSRSPL